MADPTTIDAIFANFCATLPAWVPAAYREPLFWQFPVASLALAVGGFLFFALPWTLLALWIWVLFRQWEAADGHSGYDVPWNPGRLFPLYHGPAYHDFHHKKFFGNYAGFLSYVDRFFDSYAKEYAAYRRGQTPQRED